MIFILDIITHSTIFAMLIIYTTSYCKYISKTSKLGRQDWLSEIIIHKQTKGFFMATDLAITD